MLFKSAFASALLALTILSCNEHATNMQDTETHAHTNHLIHETSPYLLQHAHNPVDWYPWGEEALNKAKSEDKPILISIGYAACHWCHVMERESFEDTAIANIMNDKFVNIKVDREERPDLDQIYMEAVTAMTGSGGWPLNVFLTPDGKPFYGGTYFPPQGGFNRPSWSQVLENIHKSFTTRREKVEEQAENLTTYLRDNTSKLVKNEAIPNLDAEEVFKKSDLDKIYNGMQARFETKEGGFGASPKFPNTMNLQFLLRYYYFTGKQEALDHTTFTLDKMIRGGIYDQIGGGFARYSTDNKWLVPHFEKMLYDNALLVTVMAEAYKITGKELYKETIDETLGWIKREMTNDAGGFYSTLDADSEGEEGKFYIWTKAEIDQILGADAALFNAFYDVSENGNWEHHNILNRTKSYAEFAAAKGMTEQELKDKLAPLRAKLLQERDKRVHPALDDKILLSWNALMTTAYANAYMALGEEAHKQAAEKNMAFILKEFKREGHEAAFYHTYKDGKVQHQAFLEDYAYLIEAMLALYEINYDESLLKKADICTQYVFENFHDSTSQLFYFTSVQQKDILLRSKEIYDQATPSGNSTMAGNLQRLSIITGKREYAETAVAMLNNSRALITDYSTSFGRWANNLSNYVYPMHEIAVLGNDAHAFAKNINAQFIPNKFMMASKKETNAFPLLEDKPHNDETLIYVCRNFACKLPVNNIEDFKKTIAIQ